MAIEEVYISVFGCHEVVLPRQSVYMYTNHTYVSRVMCDESKITNLISMEHIISHIKYETLLLKVEYCWEQWLPVPSSDLV